MRMYPAHFLSELRELTSRHEVLLVADEVFTGYGRTGTMWACDRAGITPDVMCIGKVFSTVVPMAATLVTDAVFDSYRGGERGRALYYGHTFCGNPIGAALAREVLAIYRDERIVERTQPKARKIADAFTRLGERLGRPARATGMIGAIDLGGEGYLADVGWRVYEEALGRGAYLRPLGDTVYVCPPLVISDGDLDELLAILTESIAAV
jgi:adenosylmethionine-8-amino-7-oxononanoate aminotransferase